MNLKKNDGVGKQGNKQVVTVALNPSMDKTLNIAGFTEGSLNRVDESRLDPGGKGINVARIASSFEMDVISIGFIAGTQGNHIIKKLKNDNIHVDFVIVDGETRTNLKIVDSIKKITTEINEMGFDVNDHHVIQLEEKLDRALQDADILVLGGSLPKGVPSSIYRDYINKANLAGVKTILDADSQAFREGLLAVPFAIKPNLFELEQWYGRKLETDREVIEAAKEILGLGVSMVIVSLGKEGAIVMNENEGFRVHPFSIVPQSTVGAGDSMVAALAYSLISEKSLEEIARWTTTAGTLTASKAGTQVCTYDEIKKHVHAVKISKFDF